MNMHANVMGGRAISLIALLSGSFFGTGVGPLRAQVSAIEATSGTSAVVIDLNDDVDPGRYRLVVGDEQCGTVVVFRDGDRTRLAGLLDDRAKTSRRVSLVPQSEPDTKTVRFNKVGYDVEVRIGDQLFTRYIASDTESAKPYLFPILGPDGLAMTRAYPMQDVDDERKDHPHHRSFWFTHGEVNGVDFWSERPGRHGTIVEDAKLNQIDGASAAVLQTRNLWKGLDGSTIAEDQRTYIFYGALSPRIIDFHVNVRALDEPLTFGSTKEGAFGIRVASSMDVDRDEGGMIINANGLTDREAWGKPAPWVDYVGPVDGRTIGAAIFNHPESFRFPTTWHVRTYGLFAANPFGYEDFGAPGTGEHTIPAGGSMTLRYRVLLHEGDSEQAQIAQRFEVYAHPPTIEVTLP